MPGPGITAFAMELVPRITRAQTMDVLSSQANLAGYKAVLDAAAEFGRAFPMMMTAAGTIAPARVLVMGAGVAGLQAIATARRLGAIVSATDVRAAAKEQVESLGASFLTVDRGAMKAAETAGGYATRDGRGFSAPPARAGRRGAEEDRHRHLHRADPGPQGAGAHHRGDGRRHARRARSSSISRSSRAAMSRAAGRANGRPRATASRSSATPTCRRASRSMRARSMPATCWRFSRLIIDKDKTLKIDAADEIIKATLLTRDGAVVHPALAQPAAAAPPRQAPEAAMDGTMHRHPLAARRRARRQCPRPGAEPRQLAQQIGTPQPADARMAARPFVFELTVFVLACFVGYYVVWRVTPALHSPLMSVTNAISSVIIVGALIAAGPAGISFAKIMGFVAVTLASVNIFGGFIVTQRMLQMFKERNSEVGRDREREPLGPPLSRRLGLLHHGAARACRRRRRRAPATSTASSAWSSPSRRRSRSPQVVGATG